MQVVELFKRILDAGYHIHFPETDTRRGLFAYVDNDGCYCAQEYITSTQSGATIVPSPPEYGYGSWAEPYIYNNIHGLVSDIREYYNILDAELFTE